MKLDAAQAAFVRLQKTPCDMFSTVLQRGYAGTREVVLSN